MDKLKSLIDEAVAEGKDVNDVVAKYLLDFHETVRGVIRESTALPTNAGVALESALDKVWYAADVIVNHSFTLDGTKSRDLGK